MPYITKGIAQFFVFYAPEITFWGIDFRVIITSGVITDGGNSKENYLRKLSDEFILKSFSEEDIFEALNKVSFAHVKLP